MNRTTFSTSALLAALGAVSGLLAGTAGAQSGVMSYQCAGTINGIQSAAVLQIEGGGIYAGPFVAGQIQNSYAAYTFTGELFGGNEGYVSLVEMPGGARIDRVWIGLGQSGFALQTEDGSRYVFNCR